MIHLLIVVCLGLSSPELAHAAPEQLYAAGNYEDALKEFLAVPLDGRDAAYYYDVGNTYFRLGRSGLALAYFEKAARLSPHDDDIEANLALARRAAARALGEGKLDPASHAWESFADRLPARELSVALALALVLFTALFARAYSKTHRAGRALRQPSCVAGAACLLVAGGFFALFQLAGQNPPAMVIEAQTVRSGPGDGFQEMARLDVGTKIRWTGVSSGAAQPGQSGWRQVRYGTDAIGWVRDSSLLLL